MPIPFGQEDIRVEDNGICFGTEPSGSMVWVDGEGEGATEVQIIMIADWL